MHRNVGCFKEKRYLCLTAKENTLLRHTDIASIYHQMKQEFKYYAFISYSSKDTSWGKELQRKLENYRMPATLCQERGWARQAHWTKDRTSVRAIQGRKLSRVRAGFFVQALKEKDVRHTRWR